MSALGLGLAAWLPSETTSQATPFLGTERTAVPFRFSEDYHPEPASMPPAGGRVEVWGGMYDVVSVDGDVVTLRRNDRGGQ